MLKQLALHQEYLPNSEPAPEGFFRQAISESIKYQRAAGYFSSSVFDLFQPEFLSFVKRGGRIQIVCSNQVVVEDYQVVTDARLVPKHENIEDHFDQEIEKLEREPEGVGALAFFATMISIGALEIQVAALAAGGIFHDKTGVFTDDEGGSVSFRGSSNETLMGWAKLGNFETLEVFCSWDPKDQDRVENHSNYLGALWVNNVTGLDVCPLSEISLHKIQKRSRDDIEEFTSVFEARDARNTDEVNTANYDLNAHKPRTLKPFQQATLDNWKENNFRGIVKHATGSGKTVTAINAISQHLATGAPAVVTVPSRLLLRQWYAEIRKDIPDCPILRCGDGHTSWRDKAMFRSYLRVSEDLKGTVILTTSDTMSSDEFLSNLRELGQALLVADEVHTLGSIQNRAILDCQFSKRLGLSATPERYGDPEGTNKIFEYFDGIIEPKITIFDAIKEGRLVNYVYHPRSVFLDDDEMNQWREITKRLVAAGINWGSSNQSSDKNESIKRLLIQRSRIAKKASGKVPVAASIITGQYHDGEYWLVYCEDMDQLEDLNTRLRSEGCSPYIYATGLHGYPEAELDDYIRQGGIMLSIRCLDEGVDIPRISHAVILASSRNPRQFIQRRGRVLRVDGIKSKAEIYDIFALPSGREAKATKSLVESEIKRGAEFAIFAINKETALMKLQGFLIDLNIDTDDISCFGDVEDRRGPDEQ